MAFQTSNRVSQLLLGKDFVKFLGSVNVLLIGVGGIGCEVLKVLTQFQLESLHILDLDTIEVSNLNRQFLFRKHHRGHYKAHVAKEVLMEDYPHLKIESYSSNIRDAEFGLKFFRKFQLVIMALDNQETRSFVNKQCMIADIPLIDAGTTGYKGQSFLLKRGETRCYDCFPRSENKKSYPACTIRTLPEKPVHCIIWAKYLFTVLFSGQLEEDDDSNLLSDIAQSISEGSQSNYERGVELFKSIFETDVVRQKEGEENVKFQHLVVLKREELLVKLEESNSIAKCQIVEESKEDAVELGECQLQASQQNKYTNIKYVDRQDLQFLQSTHPAEVNMQIFVDSFERLMVEKAKSGCVPFEKDDNVIMKFITAACNLRCVVFGLPCQTQFQVKEVAGSIVPAIASTNSIVSGIEITETLKYLQRQFFKLENNNKGNGNQQTSSRKSLNSRELYIQNDLKTKVLDVNPGKNNEECFSCNVNLLPSIIECDFTVVNLGKFIEQVIDQIKKTSKEDKDIEGEDDESDGSSEKNEKLKDYSISFGQYIIYEDSEDMEEDEIEQNAKKRSNTFDHFFKGLADSRIIVNDYDTNAIIGSYLFCHVPGIHELSVTHQIPSKENTLTWAKLFEKQAAAEAKIVKDQKELNEKKLSCQKGTGKLGDEFAIEDDEDSDDLEICQEITEETVTSLNGKRPSPSGSGQPDSSQGQSNQKKGDNQDDEDDDIIFEDYPSTKKSKLD